jgi:hypothetical protein
VHHRGGAEQQKARGAPRADCRVMGSSCCHEVCRALGRWRTAEKGTVSMMSSYDGQLYRSERIAAGSECLAGSIRDAWAPSARIGVQCLTRST